MSYIGMIPGQIKDEDDSHSDVLSALGITSISPMDIGDYNDGRHTPPIASVKIGDKEYSLKSVLSAIGGTLAKVDPLETLANEHTSQLAEMATHTEFNVHNLSPNSSFENASTFDADCIDGAKSYKAVAPSLKTYLQYLEQTEIVAGHVYYQSIWVKTSVAGASVNLFLGSKSGVTPIASTEWTRYSFLATAVDSGLQYTLARVAATAINTGEYVLFDCKLLVDLTADFGAGNEPTKVQFETMLADVPNYWFLDTTNIFNAKDNTIKSLRTLKYLNGGKLSFCVSQNSETEKITICGVDEVADMEYGNDATNVQFKARQGSAYSFESSKGYPPNVTFINKIVRFKTYLYAVAKDNTDNLYKVYRATPVSVNTALTWSEPLLTLSASANSTLCSQFNCSADYIYIGEYGDPEGGPKVFRSGDGTTWEEIWTSSTARHIHAINCDPYNTGGVWMCTGEDGKIFHSTDHGTTWETIADNDFWKSVQISFDSKFVYFADDSSYQTAVAIDRVEKVPFVLSNNHHAMIAVPGGAAGDLFYSRAFYGAVDPNNGYYYCLAQDTSTGVGNTNGLFVCPYAGADLHLRAYKLSDIMAGTTSGTEIYFHNNKVLFSQYWLWRITPIKYV